MFLFENSHKSKRHGLKKQPGIPMVNCFTPAVRSWKYWGVLMSYAVIHVHGSFFPDVGPLYCVEIPSLVVTDCKPGLPAGAWYQLWRWFRELMILVANYLVPPCPWLSSKKRKRCYEELILISSIRLPFEASVEIIELVPGTMLLLLSKILLKKKDLVLAN